MAPRALVTGSSRGIGKAIALSLAEAGYDLVVSARTVKPGETHDISMSADRVDKRPVPGSLEETRDLVEAMGRKCLILPMDLTDRASVGAGAERILNAWGGVDLIVHNGRHIGPGLMDVFLETPVNAYDPFYEAHGVAPIILTKALLPGMLERGGGQIVTITSIAAYQNPRGPAGQGGGWGLAYALGKASGHMLAGVLHAEFKDRGIRAFNVQPGAVRTERKAATEGEYSATRPNQAPPSAIAAVVTWLVTDPGGGAFSGQNIEAQAFCRERGLHPEWAV